MSNQAHSFLLYIQANSLTNYCLKASLLQALPPSLVMSQTSQIHAAAISFSDFLNMCSRAWDITKEKEPIYPSLNTNLLRLDNIQLTIKLIKITFYYTILKLSMYCFSSCLQFVFEASKSYLVSSRLV